MNNASTLSLAAVAALAGAPAVAADPAWSAGGRAGIAISGGEPANDITHSGGWVKYRLGENRHLGISVDRLVYDFERPWRVLGLAQDTTLAPKDIDAKAKSTLLRVFYERGYGSAGDTWTWHWQAGLGFAKPKIGRATGPVAGGGTFDIRTDGGTEVVPSLGAGMRYRFTRQLSAELEFVASHHVSKWKLRDSVSGRTATLKGYSSVGVQTGLSISF